MSEMQSAAAAPQQPEQNSRPEQNGRPEQNSQPEQQARQTPPAPAQQKPVRVRRVGALTSGVLLIAIGIAFAAAQFVPEFDLTLFFRLSPLILVLLGGEILFASFARDSTRIKYDFLSVLLCIFAGGAALCFSLAPQVLSYVGPGRETAQTEMTDALEQKAYALLSEESAVTDCRAEVDYYDASFTGQKPAAEDALTLQKAMGLSVTLRGPYADAAAFAADAARVRDKLAAGGLNKLNRISFYWQAEDEADFAEASLTLGGPFQLNAKPAELASLTAFVRNSTDSADSATPADSAASADSTANADSAAPAA